SRRATSRKTIERTGCCRPSSDFWLPTSASGLHRFGGFDHFPEFGVLLQSFVLIHFQTGAKEEIFQRVPAEDAMHHDSQLMLFKVDAIIADAEAMENATGAFEFAKFLQLSGHDLLRQATELAEDLQLQFLGHLRQL